MSALTQRITWVSAAIAAFVYLVETLLHEAAHGLASVAMGYSNTVIHHVYVTGGPDDAGRNLAVMAAAGPFMSFLVGLGGRWWFPRAQCTTTKLLALWTTYIGTLGWLGYLLITPIPADTGAIVYSIFGEGALGITVAIAIVPFAAYLVFRFMRMFSAMVAGVADITLTDREAAKRWAFRAALLPWLIALPLMVGASWSSDDGAFISMMVPLMFAGPLFGIWGGAQPDAHQEVTPAASAAGLTKAASVFTLLAIAGAVIYQVVLAPGIAVG